MIEVWLGRDSDAENGEHQSFFEGELLVHSPRGVRPNERALLPLLPRNQTGRALVMNSYAGFLGFILKALNPGLEVICWFDDAWECDYAKAAQARNSSLAAPQIVLSTDPPAGPFELILLPNEFQGIVDLVRERVRLAASELLAPKGKLIVSSDNPRDTFIRDELKRAFGSASGVPEAIKNGGITYTVRKPAVPLVNPPASDAEFSLREGDQVLAFRTRLGMFCHGRLDVGTNALLKSMDVSGARRILDLGCGSGVVGILAALRAPSAHVCLVDSNARSIQCSRFNAERHGVAERLEFVLSANATADVQGTFDVVLTNPPYFGNLRISRMFLETANHVLAPGGSLQLVTKSPDWHQQEMERLFGNCSVDDRSGYFILMSKKPG